MPNGTPLLFAVPNNLISRTLSQGLRLKFRLSHAMVGGLTISLNSIVPQTSSAKPATCSHLKLSQPRPSDTSQMKSVRHVSIVLRAVAEIWRVTERPKKLKPLGRKRVSMTMGKGGVRVGVGKAYPMDTMIMRDVTAMVRLVNIWWKPSRASK
jgi:hypothetical protein